MTLSDVDLETRLREQRTRVEEIPPAPFDLAQRVRVRAREQRRRRIALAAAGVAAALVFVGLPVLASGLVAKDSRGEAASPSAPRPLISLFDGPTRGSLAGDEDWVAGVRSLSWLREDIPSWNGEIAGPDPAPADRTVAFAGDVPGGRVALVVAPTEDRRLMEAWFTGPRGASPGEMTLATSSEGSSPLTPRVLWAEPDPASDRAVLVYVGRPGDELDVLTSRVVAASGEEQEVWEPVPIEDGVGAIASGSTTGWPPSFEVRPNRDGRESSVYPELHFGDSVMPDGTEAALEVADPRGLLDVADGDQLRYAVQALASHYTLPPERLGPTLLAAGPVGDASSTSALLVGITFPSGATMAHLVTYRGIEDGQGGVSAMGVFTQPAPAGEPLLDRLIAVPAEHSVTVSGPFAGVLAEIYLRDGTLLTTLPLVDGAGSGPLPPPAAERVRILDASGAVVAEGPLSERG